MTHEFNYYKADFGALTEGMDFVIVGCGALGSNLAVNFARQGFAGVLHLVDHDRVEDGNLSIATYTPINVGQAKVNALAYWLEVINLGIDVRTYATYLDATTLRRVKPLRHCAHNRKILVFDCVDNITTRQFLADQEGWNMLHLGINEGYGEVAWDDVYQAPKNGPDNERPSCEVPYSLTIAQFVTALALDSVYRYLIDNKKISTLVDLHWRKFHNYTSENFTILTANKRS